MGEGARAQPRVAAKRIKPAAGGEGLVLVGTSTGGPPALEALLTGLPATFPWPIVVAQHMPATFTGPLARRLDGLCQLGVVRKSGSRSPSSRDASTSAAATPT